MKEGSNSDVTFVTILVPTRVASKYTLNQFTKEGSHSNVTSAATVFLEKLTSKHTLNQFMKERSSNVTSVTIIVLIRVI